MTKKDDRFVFCDVLKLKIEFDSFFKYHVLSFESYILSVCWIECYLTEIQHKMSFEGFSSTDNSMTLQAGIHHGLFVPFVYFMTF